MGTSCGNAPCPATNLVLLRWRFPRRAADSLGLLGQNAKAVGPGQSTRAAHPLRPHRFGRWRGGHPGRAASGLGIGDNTLKVRDLASGCELRTLSGHTGLVTGVAVTPDGQRAVSASGDMMLKVWDLDNGLELRTLSGHISYINAVAVTPDGQWAVSAS